MGEVGLKGKGKKLAVSPAKALINGFCSNGNGEGESKSAAGIIFLWLRASHLSWMRWIHAMNQKQYHNSSISTGLVEKDLSGICSSKFIPRLLTQHTWVTRTSLQSLKEQQCFFFCWYRKDGPFCKLNRMSLCLLFFAPNWETELPRWPSRVTSEWSEFAVSFLDSFWLSFHFSCYTKGRSRSLRSQKPLLNKAAQFHFIK